MTDTDILLQTFLGDDLAQSVTAELGEGVIGIAYMRGAMELHEMIIQGGDEIDHLQLAEDIESAIDGLFIGPDDEPVWEEIEEIEEIDDYGN